MLPLMRLEKLPHRDKGDRCEYVARADVLARIILRERAGYPLTSRDVRLRDWLRSSAAGIHDELLDQAIAGMSVRKGVSYEPEPGFVPYAEKVREAVLAGRL